ncbi:MAG: TldD/PmbA family protein [Candidatus Aphodosoma sp.]
MTYTDIIDCAIQHATDAGCNAVKAILNHETTESIEWRNGELNYISSADSLNLTIGLYVDGRFSIADTNRLSPADLHSFIATNVANTRLLAPDPCRRLPDPSLYYRGKTDCLDLADNGYDTVTFDEKSRCTETTCKEMSDKRTISAAASFDDIKTRTIMKTTNGFHGESAYTRYSLTATASVKGMDDERPEDFGYTADTHWHRLLKTGIGADALRKAVAKTGAKRIGTGRYTVVVDCQVSGKLVQPLINAIGGQAQYYKNSFLLGKRGSKIASPLLTLTDTPVRRGMIGATLFDNDGIAAADLPLIEQGILSNYLISQYMCLKMQQTGRNDCEATRGATTILEFGNRQGSQADLLHTMHNGLLITGFNGGNCNGTTGDFSYGIEGFTVENGIIARPVSGMLMTGNMIELWQNLQAVADDAPAYVTWHTPTLLFSDIAIN